MAERYKIYDKLGSGGGGAVFRAYDNELKRWVAIKRLISANDASGDQDLAVELRREADALASLRNPNIVTIFDVASDGEGLFMVMELLEGEDLADVVTRGPLHYDDFKELATQTLEALLGAHQRHILHRDIKPENIKVERLPGGRMQSKIIDFGLAREGMKARTQTEDQAGTVMGSIFYMAPEQLTRMPVDVRTDLYALGCVFYESLSGRKAFDGESMNAVIDKHINHDIIPLNLVAPHVPPWLGAWVLRLMALNPEDRPDNAQQAIEEFRAWEKMSAAPPMMPWMPAGYGQPQGGAYTQPMYPGSMTTGTIPLQPGYYPQQAEGYVQPVLEVIPDASPITEMAAYTTPLSRPAPAPPPSKRGPARPAHTQNKPTGKIQAAPKQASTRLHSPAPRESSLSSKSDSGSGPNKALIFGLLGGAIVVVLVAGWFIFGSKKDHASGGKAAGGFLSSGEPQPVAFQLPKDRTTPPASEDLALHLVGGIGDTNEQDQQAAHGSSVLEWHDIAALGNDNLVRAYGKNPEHAPKRTLWPIKSNEPTAKAKRNVLEFYGRGDKPIALLMSDPASESQKFPFGSTAPTGDPGMTLAVVFQADDLSLPMRVFTFSSQDNQFSVTLRVDRAKKLIGEFRNIGVNNSITSRLVDPTKPCVVIMTWQAGTGITTMRAHDAPGKTFNATAKTHSPTAPLSRLQLGKVVGDKEDKAPAEEQFTGYLAEMLVYSSVLSEGQIQQLENQVLRDYYMEGPAPAQAPPSAPAPTPKKSAPSKK